MTRVDAEIAEKISIVSTADSSWNLRPPSLFLVVIVAVGEALLKVQWSSELLLSISSRDRGLGFGVLSLDDVFGRLDHGCSSGLSNIGIELLLVDISLLSIY